MSKKNFILGVILVVLIIFAYVQQGPWQEWKAKAGKIDNFLASINIEDIQKVEIQDPGMNLVLLEKQGDDWKIGGTKDFYVKKKVTGDLNNTLKEMIKGHLEIVSKNAGKKNEFETDDSGIKLKIFANDVEHSVIIGKIGPTAGFSYLSRADDNNTYLLDSNARNVFLQDDWREDQMFSFMNERAKKVRFQYPNREFMIEKIENGWKGTKPYEFEVTEDKINEILNIMGDLRATAIPEQTFVGTGLEKNSLIVEVFDSITSYTIMIGDANEDGLYYAKKGSSDNIYLITKEERDVLDVNIKDLK